MSEVGEPEAETPQPEEQPSTKRRWVLAAAAVILLAAALIWWRPWDSRSTCVEDDAHVIDSDSGLCYVVPEHWRPAEADVLNEHGYTSGLDAPSDAPTASVFVGRLDDLLDGSLSEEDDLEAVARQLAGSSALNSSKDPDVKSETTTIDDHEAATARGTITSSGDDRGVYVRVTVVELPGGRAVLISTALTGPGETGEQEEHVDAVDEVHDSISAA